ncbi:MAG: hypothetical protein GEU77_03220 [Deltaproteobacteria bacterium]|nr:hypothetical protein [Deltaproteobacteria bacterium]
MPNLLEDRRPDKEDAPQPDVLFSRRDIEKKREGQQIGDKKSLSKSDEARPCQLGDQGRKRRIDGNHAEKSSGFRLSSA